MGRDWRLENLEAQPHLRGVRFERKPYRAYRPGWEHDHCAACSVKLAEPGAGYDDAINEGYATTAEFVHGAGYEWVCVPCFERFAGVMAWVDATPPNPG